MGKRVRVLWFTNVEVPESKQKALLNSDARGWMSTLALEITKDIELHVATIHARKNNTSKGDLLVNHFIRPNYIKLRLLIKITFGFRNWEEGNLTKRMLALVDEVKPDIVHIHGSEKQYINLVPYLNKAGIPVLVSIQGLISVIAKKFTAGYSEVFAKLFIYNWGFKKNAVLPRTHWSQLRHFRKQARVEEDMLRQVPFFAGRTHWDRSIVGLLNPNSTYFHVDRILKPIYYDNVWNSDRLDGEDYQIHTTTGNSIYKGFEVIAEAAYLLEQSGFSFIWRIAGLDEMSWSVKAAKRKLGCRYPKKKTLVFLGKVNATKLVDSMMVADQYVSASHIENSPNNLAEAMMLGLPCIATDVGGTSTYIENNITGMLVPQGDPHALAGSILILSRDKLKRMKLGEEARLVSLERHNPEKVRKSLLDAYKNIVALNQ